LLLGAEETGNVTGPDTGDTDISAGPIAWLRLEGITLACDAPINDVFCPDASVTRAQMAALLASAAGLTGDAPDAFADDAESAFEPDINRLAAAGIARGCNPPVNDRYCPTEAVTRAQMAAFLTRAFGLPATDTDSFRDDDASPFEDDINRLAAAGITFGCNPPQGDRFCPRQTVTRAQMATFLWRAYGSPSPTAPQRLVAAGDIADCNLDGDTATADLIDWLLEEEGVVAALGDTAYPDGSPAQYTECYEPTWGRHRFRTRPAVGNHEYRTPEAGGYFEYFGNAAGQPGEGWYAYELGTWHIIVLNSNCAEVDCEAGSEQEQWLRTQLSTDPHLCTLAYMHHPRFSSGRHGDDETIVDLWQALQDYGVEAVLAGHDHNYERLRPITARGELDTEGLPSFVVGTGGKGLRPVGQQRPGSEFVADNAHGVLVLDLFSFGYTWQFVDTGGSTLDNGSAPCI
jgi:hypothetical protein